MKKVYRYVIVLCVALTMVLSAWMLLPTAQEDISSYDDWEYRIGHTVEQKTFSSPQEFETFMNSYTQSAPNYLPKTGGVVGRAEMDMVASNSESLDSSYSSTNNQEEGVDEADIFKTDGEYIYTVSGRTLFIAKAYPAKEAKLVFSQELDLKPQGLFVNDDSLLLFGHSENESLYEMHNVSRAQQLVCAQTYDISSPSQTQLKKRVALEGTYTAARMVGDVVYLVTNMQSGGSQPIGLPGILRDGRVEQVAPDSIVHLPLPYQQPSLVSVHSFDLTTDGELINSKAVTAQYPDSVYMSQTRVYIVSRQDISPWSIEQEIIRQLLKPRLSQADLDLIKEIRAVDNRILSSYEKEAKIMNVYQAFVQSLSASQQDAFRDEKEMKLKERLEEIDYFTYSVVSSFDVDGTAITHGPSTTVPGKIVNQFSLDEEDDYLRMATTIPPRWSRFEKTSQEASNAVWVLDKEFSIVGNVTGIAVDEQIYSTRFVDDRLYMVTFKQVDPFFVIDLASPQEPRILGELKIPGYSRYLHPFGEDVVIGLGRNATATGRPTGLKIALFDVSDIANPQVVAQYVGDQRYLQTTAEFEHKAFLASQEKNLLVIPAYNPDYSWDDSSGEGFNGAFVFNISSQDISLRGLIDHSQKQANNRDSLVQRSAFIHDVLYTKSSGLLRLNDLETLEGLQRIELHANKTSIPVY